MLTWWPLRLPRRARMADPKALEQWARERSHPFRRARDGQGCVIEGRQGPQAWRIEWGPSQRNYIPGNELRLIADIDLPSELMAMVINRELMAWMEDAVYAQYVGDVQTRLDDETPAEMRWMVMCTKLSTAQMGRLQVRYGGVCTVTAWLQQWLSGPLNDALAATIDLPGSAERPVVLTVARGRVTLRTTMAQPDAASLAVWYSVFEHALREARRLGTEWRHAAGTGLTTQPSAWANSELVRT